MDKMKQTVCFNMKQTLINCKAWIDEYNTSQKDPKKRIKSNVRATAEHLIYLWMKYLGATKTIIEGADLPPVKTYVPSMAKRRGMSDRTVQRHKKILIESGFISSEEVIGKGGLSLCLNPTMLLKDQPRHLSIDVKGDKMTPISSGSTRTLEKIEREKELWMNEIEQDLSVNNTSSKNGLKKFRETIAGLELTDSSPLPKFQNELVIGFCLYALDILYPGLLKTLSIPERKAIYSNVHSSVFLNFRRYRTTKEWNKFQEQAFKGVDLCRDYLIRNPQFVLPTPHLYFHPDHEKYKINFRKTWLWQENYLIKKIMTRIKREVQLHHQGKGKYTSLSLMDLKRHHEVEIAKYKLKNLSIQFNHYAETAYQNKGGEK